MKKYLCLLLASLLLTGCAPLPPAETGGTTQPSATKPTTATTVPTTDATEATPPETPVETKTVWFWTEKKQINTDGGSVYKRTYDAKGNLLTDTFSSGDGKTDYGSSYTYDAAGKMLTHDSYDNYSTGHGEFTYDAAGRLAGETFSNSDGYSAKVTYTYREDGLLTETLTVYGKTEDRTTYTYDEKGNLLKKAQNVVKNGKTTYTHTVEWTYDEAGNKLFETDSGGFRTEWTYDERGKALSCTDLDNAGNIRKGMLYEYDEQNGLFIQYPFESDPKAPTEKFVYEYDETGKLMVKYFCTPNSSRFNASGFCRYTYDENGNLLSEITTKKDGTELSRIEYTYISMELPVK